MTNGNKTCVKNVHRAGAETPDPVKLLSSNFASNYIAPGAVGTAADGPEKIIEFGFHR
jgi:hypothetical protein